MQSAQVCSQVRCWPWASPVQPSLVQPDKPSTPGKPNTQRLDPELIHPELWRGHQLGRARHSVLPTGHPALDHQLPGGGWPKQALTELLIRQPGVGEMRLLAPALVAVVQGQQGPARSVMLFDPPTTPCAWGLQQLGVDPRALIVVQGAAHSPSARDVLWALEQALRSGHAGAILAWLPSKLGPETLRRLQLAAQAHDGVVFLFRGLEARLKPSPAPLRLVLRPSLHPSLHPSSPPSGPGGLTVQLLKRRGPALAHPLELTMPLPAALQRLWVPGTERAEPLNTEQTNEQTTEQTTEGPSACGV